MNEEVEQEAQALAELQGIGSEYAQHESTPGEQQPEQQPEAEPEVPTAELLEPIVGFACGVLVPNWDIKKEEVKALAEGYAAVLDKYYPDIKGGVELNALLMTVAIFGPRVAMKVPPRVKVVDGERVDETREAKAGESVATGSTT